MSFSSFLTYVSPPDLDYLLLLESHPTSAFVVGFFVFVFCINANMQLYIVPAATLPVPCALLHVYYARSYGVIPYPIVIVVL